MVNLDELMRLHEAATPGPWKVNIGDFESEDGYGTVTAPYVEADGKTICVPFDRGPDDENDEADAAYIVAACNAMPELVAQIRELEEQVIFLNKTADNLAYNPCLTCVDNPHNCPRELYSPDNDNIESVIVCCRMKHACRDSKINMLVDGKIFMGHPKCPTPGISCHARNGDICMSDNHLPCSQAVNEKSLKQVSALEPCLIVSNNNSTQPEWLMHRFTEVK